MPKSNSSSDSSPSSKRHHGHESTTTLSPPLSPSLFAITGSETKPELPATLSPELFSIQQATLPWTWKRQREEMSPILYMLDAQPTPSSSQSSDASPCCYPASSQESSDEVLYPSDLTPPSYQIPINQAESPPSLPSSEDSEPYSTASAEDIYYHELICLSQASESSPEPTPSSSQQSPSMLEVEATPPSSPSSPPSYQPPYQAIPMAHRQAMVSSTRGTVYYDTLPKHEETLSSPPIETPTEYDQDKIYEDTIKPIRVLISQSRFAEYTPEEALAILKKALMQYKTYSHLHTYNRFRHKELVTWLTINFAKHYLALNNLYFAEKHIAMAGNLQGIQHHKAMLTEAMMYQGELLRQQHNLPLAIQKLEDALTMAKELKPLTLSARIHVVLAKTYVDSGERKHAQAEAQKAMMIFETEKLDMTHPWVKSACELLASLACAEAPSLPTVSTSRYAFNAAGTSSPQPQSRSLLDTIIASEAKQSRRSLT